MTKLDISLPDDLKALADERIAVGQYASLSDYLADLIRRDQEQQQVETLLAQRIDASPSQEMTDTDFGRIRQRVQSEIAQRRTS